LQWLLAEEMCRVRFQSKHWTTLVPDTRAARRILIRDIASMVEAIGGEADALIAEPAGEEIKHPVLKATCNVISSRAGLLRRGT
jgi:serine/threonine-protein kinase HipA